MNVDDMDYDQAMAEIELLAWESRLPDLPKNQEVLLVEGEMTEGSLKRVKEFVERRVMGGSKAQEVLVIEGDCRFEMVGGIKVVEEIIP